MKDKHLIELIDVSKLYGGDVALSHVDLYIKDGEFLTLLGPSGCGKTTMLRLIAGFIMPDEGRIWPGCVPCLMYRHLNQSAPKPPSCQNRLSSVGAVAPPCASSRS